MAELQLNKKKKSGFDKFLNGIEKAGNKIPEPMMLFVWLSIFVIVLSFILSKSGYSAIHPGTKEKLTVVNLLSVAGLQKILSNAVTNFSGFYSLGVVLVAMLGVGLCEKSGLFTALLRKSMSNIKGSKVKVVLIVVFASIVSNIAGDSGFIIMPAIGAMIFAAAGRNPIAGALCAYSSVAGAFSANIIVGTLDVMLTSFTESAVKLINPNFSVHPMMTYYFQLFSVFMLTIVATWVTLKFVEPRVGAWTNSDEKLEEITPKEVKAMKWAGAALLVYLIIVAAGIIPQNGILRDPETHSAIVSAAPLMKGLVILITLAFFIPGVVYGKLSGKFKSSRDIVATLSKCMSDMGSYIVLIFFIAQFVSFFGWSNLGMIFAINGANALEASGLPIIVVIILLILLCILIDIFIGSASAKWAIMAPIFIPMFMLLGYHPALIQMAYKIGDSVINVITPLSAYFPIIYGVVRKYNKDAGMGTIIANMTPYSIWFLAFWLLQLVAWYLLKLPMGPGAPMMM